MITITLETTSDAMQHESEVARILRELADDIESEVARILRELADDIESGRVDESTTLRDINGNTCGRFEFDPEEEE